MFEVFKKGEGILKCFIHLSIFSFNFCCLPRIDEVMLWRLFFIFFKETDEERSPRGLSQIRTGISFHESTSTSSAQMSPRFLPLQFNYKILYFYRTKSIKIKISTALFFFTRLSPTIIHIHIIQISITQISNLNPKHRTSNVV